MHFLCGCHVPSSLGGCGGLDICRRHMGGLSERARLERAGFATLSCGVVGGGWHGVCMLPWPVGPCLCANECIFNYLCHKL